MANISDGNENMIRAKEIKRFFGHNWIETKLEDFDGFMGDEKNVKSMDSPLLNSFFEAYRLSVQKKVIVPDELLIKIKL